MSDIQTPIAPDSPIAKAIGHLGFLQSVIRSGERLFPDEEATVHSVTEELREESARIAELERQLDEARKPRELRLDEIIATVQLWLTKYGEYGELRDRLYETEQALAAEKTAREKAEGEIIRWRKETGWDTPEAIASDLGRVFEEKLPSGLVKQLLRIAWTDLKKAEAELAEERERLDVMARQIPLDFCWTISRLDSGGWFIQAMRTSATYKYSLTAYRDMRAAIDEARKKGT